MVDERVSGEGAKPGHFLEEVELEHMDAILFGVL